MTFCALVVHSFISFLENVCPLSKHKLDSLKIHASETAWVGGDIDTVIENNGTIDELFEQLKNQVSDPHASILTPA